MKSVLLTNTTLNVALTKHQYKHEEKSYPRSVDQTIEEMAELTKVLIKERRGRDGKDDIEEEIADVIIMIECLIRERNITLSRLNKVINKKLTKWLKNIESGKD